MMRLIDPDLAITYGWGGTDALIASRLARIPVVYVRFGSCPTRCIVKSPDGC